MKRRTEKRRRSDQHETLFLQTQKGLMAKSDEKDRLAMQELMKFKVEAEKRHQVFTLAAVDQSQLWIRVANPL